MKFHNRKANLIDLWNFLNFIILFSQFFQFSKRSKSITDNSVKNIKSMPEKLFKVRYIPLDFLENKIWKSIEPRAVKKCIDRIILSDHTWTLGYFDVIGHLKNFDWHKCFWTNCIQKSIIVIVCAEIGIWIMFKIILIGFKLINNVTLAPFG